MDVRFKLKAIAKRTLPESTFLKLSNVLARPTKSRRDANQWLKEHCRDITGKVLSIGSAEDSDGEGQRYRDYFSNADSYTTSEVEKHPDADLLLDVRNMPEIKDATYDAIFCSGVLEHVDEISNAMKEITRILKPGGILILGLPFRQSPHMEPFDFWRFTEYGVKFMLLKDYDLENLYGTDDTVHNFPAAYLARARKKNA
jgi:SAM-dependent methyltransferase